MLCRLRVHEMSKRLKKVIAFRRKRTHENGLKYYQEIHFHQAFTKFLNCFSEW